MRTYPLRYTFNVETRKKGYLLKDVMNDYHGLCDAVALVSMNNEPYGGYSQMNMSFKSDEEADLIEMSPDDIFKMWTMIGLQLSRDDQLTEGKQIIVNIFANTIRDVMGV